MSPCSSFKITWTLFSSTYGHKEQRPVTVPGPQIVCPGTYSHYMAVLFEMATCFICKGCKWSGVVLESAGVLVSYKGAGKQTSARVCTED